MPVFRFRATDSRGIEWNDIIEADTRSMADDNLQSRGLVVVELRRVPESGSEQMVFELSSEEVSRLQNLKNRRHPLGWPPGSVRALLTLMLVCYVSIFLLVDADLPALWSEILMIAIVHYFTVRRHVMLPESIRDDLVRMDLMAGDEHPLGLPRHSVRLIITASLMLVLIVMVLNGRGVDDSTIGVFLALAAFLIGSLMRSGWAILTAHTEIQPLWWWGDLKALATLTILLLALGMSVVSLVIPPPIPLQPLQNVGAAVALFYFGSR